MQFLPSFRGFLWMSVLLLVGKPLLPHQTATNATYRLTVWTIRPQVKRSPTQKELQSDALHWMNLQGFDKPTLKNTQDQKILDYLRKANPLFTIPGIQQKAVVSVPEDTLRDAGLASDLSFKIMVKMKDHEAAISEIAQTHGKALADEFRRLSAQEIILFLDIRIPHLDNKSQATLIKGYRSVKPGFIYAVNPNLDYETKLVHAAPPGGKEEYIVQQLPNDVVLFCIQPAKAQKGNQQ